MLPRPRHPLIADSRTCFRALHLSPRCRRPYDGRCTLARHPWAFSTIRSAPRPVRDVLHWHGALARLDAERREKVARYAEEIAATLAAPPPRSPPWRRTRATRAAREAIRELGRIAGYVEDIVHALEDHLDGRKLAGVKRRLEQLAGKEPMRAAARQADAQRVERLLEAEGYFRALADGLRT